MLQHRGFLLALFNIFDSRYIFIISFMLFAIQFTIIKTAPLLITNGTPEYRGNIYSAILTRVQTENARLSKVYFFFFFFN